MRRQHLRAIFLGRICKYEAARKACYDEDNLHQAAYYNGKISALRYAVQLLDELEGE